MAGGGVELYFESLVSVGEGDLGDELGDFEREDVTEG